ncbi:MAG: sulfide/dihydroorotate dehydrogenase-like FAD/NAD-binding protein [Clostridia bacterium]|nr:sulfide/dihydroorotate dehydrogenase-like FAD/NAD-binding protein [Clostridia bacterium]
MFRIARKKVLNFNTVEYDIEAPLVAGRCRGGQFVILRVDENGERVPFTIADYDRAAGTVTIIVQTIGASTYKLSLKNEGECIADFVGPLGNPTDLNEYENVVLVGGGIGSAVIYPQTAELKSAGKKVTVIVGAKTKELIIHEDDFRARADELFLMTDDGSYGEKGFVTDALKKLLDRGGYDCVFAVGPLPMMRAVCKLTENYGVKTVVSMNSIMVDGTGMCGGCRLTVGGKTKYACVDGPEFDGHLVDFDEAINRSKIYREQEAEHYCRVTGERK